MFDNIDRELTINFIMMIVTILAALWNVFIFCSTKKSKKATKKSELKAAEYAGQASEFYKVNIRYHELEMQRQDLELKQLMKLEQQESAHDRKMNVLKVVNKEGIITTSRIAEILELSTSKTFEILDELLYHDRKVSTGGMPDAADVDANFWIKRS